MLSYTDFGNAQELTMVLRKIKLESEAGKMETHLLLQASASAGTCALTLCKQCSYFLRDSQSFFSQKS